MLLWMKSHVEALRAMVLLCAYAIDMKKAMGSEEAEKWHGIMEFMVPVLKAYGTDTGFRITENAMQVYGGYGYCKEYPVGQFLRDMKIGSIYEGTNGIQSMDLVLRKLNHEDGKNFKNLISEMNATLEKFNPSENLRRISEKMDNAVTALAGTADFFTNCVKDKKFMVPVVNCYPFLTLTGNVISAWLLYWQAGIADSRLSEIASAKNIDRNSPEFKKLTEENNEASFYSSKILTATYFLSSILPQALAIREAIMNSDLSPLKMKEDFF